MSSFADVIKKAREPENQKTIEPAPEKKAAPRRKTAAAVAPQPVEPSRAEAPEREEEVNLSIKVPKRLRRHWASEAKKNDTTLTAAISQALLERFGEPD